MTSPPELNDYPRLQALLRWLIGRPPRELTAEQLARIRARADEAGIRALVELFLRQHGFDASPERVQTMQRTRFALIRHHLRALSAEIETPFVVLKGEPLGRRLYGTGSLRSSGDLDILVRPEDVETTIERAVELGFSPPASVSPNLYENNQFALVHQQSGLLLEVHWALDLPRVPTPSVETCLEHAGRFDDTIDVLVLDDAFRILQASYHLFHHSGFLKGMVDLSALYDVVDSDAIDTARDAATSIGVTGMVDWGLAVSWLLSPVEPRRWQRAPALFAAVLWLKNARGVLLSSTPISGSELLGWKAAEHERAPRALWGLAFAGLLDRPKHRIALLLRTIFKDRRTLEAELGRAPTLLDRGQHAVSRPIELIRKTASDLLRGN